MWHRSCSTPVGYTTRDNYGDKPLQITSWVGNEMIVKKLLGHSANVAFGKKGGETPLYFDQMSHATVAEPTVREILRYVYHQYDYIPIYYVRIFDRVESIKLGLNVAFESWL